MTKKSDIREVKTVKTTKSDMERKNPSKSATIWNQTVSAITQAKSDLFQKFQNLKDSQGPKLSQIVALFDRFLHQMSLYVVFTVFTSLMSLFWSFPLKPPSKIRPEEMEAQSRRL